VASSPTSRRVVPPEKMHDENGCMSPRITHLDHFSSAMAVGLACKTETEAAIIIFVCMGQAEPRPRSPDLTQFNLAHVG